MRSLAGAGDGLGTTDYRGSPEEARLRCRVGGPPAPSRAGARALISSTPTRCHMLKEMAQIAADCVKHPKSRSVWSEQLGKYVCPASEAGKGVTAEGGSYPQPAAASAA